MKPIVVMPTYNEAETLPAMPKHCSLRHPRLELLVVATTPRRHGRVAESLAEGRPVACTCCTDQGRGAGRSYISGFAKALDLGAEAVSRWMRTSSLTPTSWHDKALEYFEWWWLRYIAGVVSIPHGRLGGASQRMGEHYARRHRATVRTPRWLKCFRLVRCAGHVSRFRSDG